MVRQKLEDRKTLADQIRGLFEVQLTHARAGKVAKLVELANAQEKSPAGQGASAFRHLEQELATIRGQYSFPALNHTATGEQVADAIGELFGFGNRRRPMDAESRNTRAWRALGLSHCTYDKFKRQATRPLAQILSEHLLEGEDEHNEPTTEPFRTLSHEVTALIDNGWHSGITVSLRIRSQVSWLFEIAPQLPRDRNVDVTVRARSGCRLKGVQPSSGGNEGILLQLDPPVALNDEHLLTFSCDWPREDTPAGTISLGSFDYPHRIVCRLQFAGKQPLAIGRLNADPGTNAFFKEVSRSPYGWYEAVWPKTEPGQDHMVSWNLEGTLLTPEYHLGGNGGTFGLDIPPEPPLSGIDTALTLSRRRSPRRQ